MKFLDHLEELRKRLIFVVYFLVAFFLIGVIFTNPILRRLKADFISSQAQLIVLTPIEYFIVQLKIGLYVGVLAATPIAAYHIFQFVRPAIKKKKLFNTVMYSFLLLYIIGLACAYFLFVPITMHYLTPFAPSLGIANLWSLNSLVGLVFIMIYSTALTFQIPLIMLTLAKLGIVSAKWFHSKRRHVYVAITIIAALVTPGVDIVTQIIAMIPMILLFEFGIFLLWLFRY